MARQSAELASGWRG